MTLQSYLDEMGVPYKLSHHPTTYTAQDLAAVEHISGGKVIKPVVVKADGKFMLCALPASYRVDVSALREELNAREVTLVDEQTLGEIFHDCELGAEPPIGRLYGLSTLMDDSLEKDAQVTFQAGTHRDAVTMSLRDYIRLTEPQITHFARHL